MADTNIAPRLFDQQEEWRPVPDEDGYEVSSFGRVRSLDRTAYRFRFGKMTSMIRKGMILGLALDKDGYPTFCGRKIGHSKDIDGTSKNKTRYKVSRVVCLVFNGPPPSIMHVHAAHLDGNPLNNLASNLIWATVPQNASHRVLHGTDRRGSKSRNAKISSDDLIVGIFSAYANGESSRSIARRFEVGYGQILTIIWREQWKHVPIDPQLVKRAQAVALSRPGPIRYANRRLQQ